MKKKFIRITFYCCLCFCLFLLILPEAFAETDSITIFCGSANKPPMEEIAREFESREAVKVHMIFGGSGTLLSQIELSKKGEIYLPGSPDYIIKGKRKKLLIEDSDRIVSYLVPAIITPAGNPGKIKSLEDLTKAGKRVGIGNPETVCLGLYGIELLEYNKLLRPVLNNVVTFGASCSKTANLASLKQVDAILGWRVFHYWNPSRMDVVLLSPEQIPRISHISISIPVYTKYLELSEKFIDFVISPIGRAIYEKYGYLTSLKKAKEFSPNASIGGEYQLPEEYFTALKETVGK